MNTRTPLLILLVALPTLALHGCFPAVVAGGGAAVMMGSDRRTSGTYVEDQNIELKASHRISEKYDDRVHVDVISFNRFVLLVGEAPTQEIKDNVGVIALGVESVRNVQNDVNYRAQHLGQHPR
jgi:osmotically-inducible protein OsmY